MTNANYDDEFATRVISAIETRIERKLKSGSFVQNTWGTVASVSSDGKTAGAYLYGETDGAYISDGFRIPETTYLTIGQSIKVAMDYGTGDRWIEEVSVSTAYKKLTIGQDGVILFGSGAALSDTNLYRYAASRLATDDDLIISLVSGNGLSIGTTAAAPAYGIAFGADTNLYRSAADTLSTDDAIEVKSGLLYVGQSDLTSGSLSIYGAGTGNEGGQIDLFGAAAWANWSIDIYQSTLRFFTGGIVYYTFATGSLDLQSGVVLTWNADTNLYRSAASTLKTDDALIVLGAIQQGADSTDSIKMTGGSIEMFSANPFIDFKNAAVDNYDARIIYNLSSSGKLGFYGAPVAFNVGRIETLTAFMNGGGTSFPASPTTNDRYFRTDLQLEFFYDGARWMTTQLFSAYTSLEAYASTFVLTIAVTTTSVHRLSIDDGMGTDIWLENFTVTPYIGAGTALSASHKWVAELMKTNTSSTSTSIGTVTFDSGGSSLWRRGSVAIGALLGTLATYPICSVDWTKTGTPGSVALTGGVRLSYRIVQT